jgi:transposase InsO family protein
MVPFPGNAAHTPLARDINRSGFCCPGGACLTNSQSGLDICTLEFYEVTDTGFEIAELNRALLEWERVYNSVSPHQALGYLTPEEFPKHYHRNTRKEKVPLGY